MSIQPLHDYIAVRSIPEAQTTASGIVITTTTPKEAVQGEVLAVGTGILFDNGHVHPLTVKVGDKVLFSKYAGMPVDFQGEEILFFREKELLGIISNDKR
jgi:chaperonin GroES